jgi:cytoskeletal protein CcmA (bactofilin family)
MRRSSHRGQALLNILLITVLFVGVVFLASGNWIAQLGFSQRSSAISGARRLAEATLQLAVARLIKNPDDALASVQLSLPSYPGGESFLSCDADAAAKKGVPHSVNNLKGANSKPSWSGATVSSETANLVATASYRGATIKMEAILNVPAFPYVVCSSVPIKSVDGLQIFGVASPEALKDGFASIPEDQKVPGHLASNAKDPSGGKSIELLGTTSKIQGDVQSHGDLEIGEGVVITGERRPRSEMVQMPVLDVQTLMADANSQTSEIGGADLNSPKLTGFNKCKDLSITGGLQLESGVLYVDGKLKVQGGLSGTGAIIATGGVEISGGGSLTGDNQAAIIAKGPVTIEGSAMQTSEFRGMVYTEGNLSCKYTNIAGSVLVNNPDPTGTANLEKVAMAQDSSASKLELSVTTTAPATADAYVPFWSLANAGMGQTQIHEASGAMKFNKSAFANPNYDKNIEGSLPYKVPSPLPADPFALLQEGQIFYWQKADPSKGENKIFHTKGDLQYCLRCLCEATSFAPPNLDQIIEDTANGTASEILNKAQAYVDGLNKTGVPIGGSSTTTTWKFDLSQFFKLSDKIRVVSWRQI